MALTNQALGKTPIQVPGNNQNKRQLQKLQRAVVDGLGEVKAEDIVVFNTENLSSLFERVVIATGASNRQTRALAQSVQDAVRKAGFEKPRTEGEANGEWVIVDCGAVVVHVMQESIRGYYQLETLWGDKPVHMRLGKKPDRKSKPRQASPFAATMAASRTRTKTLQKWS